MYFSASTTNILEKHNERKINFQKRFNHPRKMIF